MTTERAIGYVRVSTIEQTEGYGLDVQRAAITAHAKTHALRLVAILGDEGISGSNGLETRQGLAEAIARIEAGEATVLIVKRLDRLARDLLLSETVIARIRATGGRVVSVEEPEGDAPDYTRDLIRQVLGAISQYERMVIKGRMSAGKAAKRAQGGYAGGQPCYGRAAKERELVPNVDEAAVVELVGQLRGDGRSYREIATALDAAGYRPRRAAAWQPMVVRAIAQRARANLQP